MKVEADLLVCGACELLTCAGAAPARGSAQRAVGSVADGAVAARRGRIVAVGPSAEVERAVTLVAGGERIDAAGRLVTPGLVDAHTHPVFAGYREDEFNRVLAGESYQDIARSGGGIRKTVLATRDASDEELARLARERLDLMLLHGTTTAEAKSGYGLSLGEERRALEVVRRLDAEHPIDLVPTLLAAHAVPPEYDGRRGAYVDLVVREIIPACAPLARFCDVFCDPTAFDRAESRAILETGMKHGLRARIHADEFEASGGAELAAEIGAVSADHLGAVPEAAIDNLAQAGITAVLLPGTLFFLGRRSYAPARALIGAGVPVALGTDLNPGSSPTESLGIVLQLACLMMRMTVEEAIVAATLNAAHSLGLGREAGSLEVGKAADLVIFDVPNRFHLVYHYGVNHVRSVVKAGRVVVRDGRRVEGGSGGTVAVL